MEKETRRRCARRQQKIEVYINKRIGTKRRVEKRRTEFDRRMQQIEVSINRRSSINRRTFE